MKTSGGIPFAIDIKGEIKMKENHDRGSKHSMMTGGADNMMIRGAIWGLPSMTKGEIVGQIGSCH